MIFDAQRSPNAVTVAWLFAERMGMGVHCQMRAACGHGSGDAALRAGDACAVSRRPVQMHALRLEADRGAAGMAGARTLVGLQVELAPDLLDDRPEGRAALGVANLVGDQDRVPFGRRAAHGHLDWAHASALGNQLLKAFGAKGRFAGL